MRIVPTHNSVRTQAKIEVSSEMALRRTCGILVSLPNDLVSANILEALEKAGHSVSPVASSITLRLVLTRSDAGCVILPVDLPSMTDSAYLTCRRILFAVPSMKVILVGREASARQRRFAKAIGAADYLCSSSPVEEYLAIVAGQ